MNMATSAHPDLSDLDIPIDSWTQPFWQAAALQQLMMPRCGDCQQFRWPPGPFCPVCRSQRVQWLPAGSGKIYSFTIVHANRTSETPSSQLVPALIEFPQAGGMRLLAAVVDTPLSEVRIGAQVEPHWSQAANAVVPVFKVRSA
jgi:uncharacterized protein